MSVERAVSPYPSNQKSVQIPFRMNSDSSGVNRARFPSITDAL